MKKLILSLILILSPGLYAQTNGDLGLTWRSPPSNVNLTSWLAKPTSGEYILGMLTYNGSTYTPTRIVGNGSTSGLKVVLGSPNTLGGLIGTITGVTTPAPNGTVVHISAIAP